MPRRRGGALTAAFTVLIAAAAAYVDALPPAPRGETLQRLILGGVPAAYDLVGWALERRLLHTAFADAALLAAGILWNFAAWHAFNGDTDGAGLARVHPETVIPWLALWLGWQAVAMRRREAAPRAAGRWRELRAQFASSSRHDRAPPRGS